MPCSAVTIAPGKGKGVSVHYLSHLLKPIDGKLIEDGIKGKRAVLNIDIF